MPLKNPTQTACGCAIESQIKFTNIQSKKICSPKFSFKMKRINLFMRKSLNKTTTPMGLEQIL